MFDTLLFIAVKTFSEFFVDFTELFGDFTELFVDFTELFAPSIFRALLIVKL